jgi:alpha-galactosidase
MTRLPFRTMTAFFGVLGFELDPTQFTAEERGAITTYIAFYKAHRALFQTGVFSRLIRPDNYHAAWMVSSPDKDEAIVGYYELLSQPNPPPLRLCLTDLDPNAQYDVSLWEDGGFAELDKAFNCGLRGGDELMRAGLLLSSSPKGDFVSELFLLKRK